MPIFSGWTYQPPDIPWPSKECLIDSISSRKPRVLWSSNMASWEMPHVVSHKLHFLLGVFPAATHIGFGYETNTWNHMEVSINGDTPKWMVYTRSSYQNGWYRGTLILGHLHIPKYCNKTRPATRKSWSPLVIDFQKIAVDVDLHRRYPPQKITIECN